jgi:hypothetical protein
MEEAALAANILNNMQSRTADKGWSSSLRLREGLRTHRKSRLLRNITQGLGLGPFI